MSEQIHRLVYFSRNAMPGTEDEIVAGVQQILASSRSNNARAGVTGALLFNSGCFAQVLEGPTPAVTETFERIQWDERHSEVLVLEYAPWLPVPSPTGRCPSSAPTGPISSCSATSP
ncbi:BLUF domain-containing protein (plasmid) [Skermanella rosea]|uniref:BLUF domain-containing protein n=1 Tax=Skermanella rosea TaxID=1817965 RepID=UPI001933F6A3|nr:BLUF domain-containing protein [Skermanella rosea]UEM07295.1 BLUF domain-containing protein [Skermanella rosea]